MGKRRKGELQNSDDKKSKKTKVLQNQEHLTNDNETIELPDKVQRTSTKPKKIIFDDNGQPAPSNPDNDSAKSVKNKIMKNGNCTNKKQNRNNKIIFEDSDDQPSLDALNNGESTEPSNQNEDEVKDEDIDKFCDEIEEEDNVQYENWVKLIEEKLTSNKKKS